MSSQPLTGDLGDGETQWLWAVSEIFRAADQVEPTFLMPQFVEFVKSFQRPSGKVVPDWQPDFPVDEFAGRVQSLLAHQPVLAMAPWGHGGRGSDSSEIDWLQQLTSWGAHPLGIIVPSAALTGKRIQKLWHMLPNHIRPQVILTGRDWFPFVPASLETAFILLSSSANQVLRMFRIPDGVALDDWRDDLSRLLVQGGGQTENGYVVREGVTRGDPLNFGYHDPSALARVADLGAFGETAQLGSLFEVVRAPARGLPPRERPESRPEPYLEISARGIGLDGRLIASEAPDRPNARPGVALAEGDVVVAEMVSRSRGAGFRCGLVTDQDVPSFAGATTLVLRPKQHLEPGIRDFVLDYLRSPMALQVYETSARSTSTLAGHLRLSPRDLHNLHVPIPDAPLAAAVRELSAVSKVFEGWHLEAAGLLSGLFENPSAEAARRQILQSGRHLRARLESAALLDDFGQTVRTQFPYPIAHRWRSLEALLSGPEREMAYRAALDTYEVFLCYSAQIAWTMARTAGASLGEAEKIRRKLADGRHGLALGEWSAILDEVAGKRFAALPDDTPLGDVRRLVPPGSAASQARVRLSNRRNDQAHLRPVPTHELETVLDEVVSDLRLLLRQAEFYVDMPLVHVASSRWDSIAKRATLATRHLAGDHPVVPYRHESTHRNDLEEGSLYVGDPVRGELHLLRPLLIGRECPECQTWSTFHIEQVRGPVVHLKSLEHGHTLQVDDLTGVLEAVGLLGA